MPDGQELFQAQPTGGTGAVAALGTRHLLGDGNGPRLGQAIVPSHQGPWLVRGELWGAGDLPHYGFIGAGNAEMASWAAGRVGEAPGGWAGTDEAHQCPQGPDTGSPLTTSLDLGPAEISPPVLLGISLFIFPMILSALMHNHGGNTG